MSYLCNPLNLSYKYQFHGRFYAHAVCREAADPSLVLFKGRYYLFASMSAGFWVSDDLVSWDYHATPGLPIHDYAPDVRVVGDYLYFCASKRNSACPFYRTSDPLSGVFEELPATMTFWDPHLFADDDGRLYFYWGCSNKTPLYGVEIDPETMAPLGSPRGLIEGAPQEHGFERSGEDHKQKEPETLGDKMMQAMAGGSAPYIEGAWMTKRDGRYYLQYAANGTEFNVYADGVYVADAPLGPFTYARNNPYSYRPGGFMPGAGHGSTLRDAHGNYWHAATMRISANHSFERRVGIFPAGFDDEGELFCNQRYGDWPIRVEPGPRDPWQAPDWMLLSYRKHMSASSSAEGCPPEHASDECERTWWKAASADGCQWLQIDLGKPMDVRAVQLNFADDAPAAEPPKDATWGGEWPIKRVIDTRVHRTRWLLEGSLDGESYFIVRDKREAQTDLPHDFICPPEGVSARFLRCTVFEVPFHLPAAISAFRVFGLSAGTAPRAVERLDATRVSPIDAEVSWPADDGAQGHAVLWGYAPDRLYHSCMTYGRTSCRIGALNAGQDLYVRVDSFNESGITEGATRHVA